MQLTAVLNSRVYHKGFINVFSRRATGFHRQATVFEVNFIIRGLLSVDFQLNQSAKSSSQLVYLLVPSSLVSNPAQLVIKNK